MFLRGEKIILRYVKSHDTDTLYKWENDRSHWRMSGTKKSFTKKEIKDFILKQTDIYLDKQLRLMIKNLKDDAIGCIDLFDFNEREKKSAVGILIDKKHRKNGYASEALSLLSLYCFEILNLKKLYCTVSSENVASINLFKKNNFKHIKPDRASGRREKNIFLLELLNH